MHPARIRDREQGNLQWKIIRFEYDHQQNAYIGVAWNYDIPALITSGARAATYTEAQAKLERACAAEGYSLRWFEGEYIARNGEECLTRAPGQPRATTGGA